MSTAISHSHHNPDERGSGRLTSVVFSLSKLYPWSNIVACDAMTYYAIVGWLSMQQVPNLSVRFKDHLYQDKALVGYPDDTEGLFYHAALERLKVPVQVTVNNPDARKVY